MVALRAAVDSEKHRAAEQQRELEAELLERNGRIAALNAERTALLEEAKAGQQLTVRSENERVAHLPSH